MLNKFYNFQEIQLFPALIQLPIRHGWILVRTRRRVQVRLRLVEVRGIAVDLKLQLTLLHLIIIHPIQLFTKLIRHTMIRELCPL